jgi:16S rRNA (guanine966-N2)-methyltransferase
MRVIAGTAKGTRLARAPGGVRPVSDRVREGLFSSLGGEVPGARVLDLFAGTGALGIEALSRGAEAAVFVDRSPKAIRAVRENLAVTRLGDRATVVRAAVARYLDRPASGSVVAPFDLVFVDPPYDLGRPELDDDLAALAAGPLLARDATVALTRGSRSSTVVIPLDWMVAKRLAYGDSVVTLFRSRIPPR